MYNPNIMRENDDATRYLTGLSWNIYRIVADLLVPFIKIPRKNLPPESQLFMVLVRLRLNMPFCYISHQTGFSLGSLNKTFQSIIDLMYQKLKFLIRWPDVVCGHKTLPPVFKENFPRLTSIIDCFEVFIERPSRLKARAQVYSNYKKHSTVKFLLCCSPLGVVTFLSKAWGGRASDVEIVRSSGFISPNYHLPDTIYITHILFGSFTSFMGQLYALLFTKINDHVIETIKFALCFMANFICHPLNIRNPYFIIIFFI